MNRKLMSCLMVTLALVGSLRADYSRLDFFKCQGGSGTTSYTAVITDYAPASTDRIEFKLRPTQLSGTQCLFCSRGTDSKNTITTFIISGTQIRYDRLANSLTYSGRKFTSADLSSDFIITYDGNAQKGYVNDANAVNLTSASAYTGGSKLMLFSSHTAGTGLSASSALGNFAYYRFYHCRIYNKSGVLVHNYVPARDNSKVSGAADQCGVWDTVTGQFFANVGSKGFDTTGATVIGTLGEAAIPTRTPTVNVYGTAGDTTTVKIDFPNPGFAQRLYLAWSASTFGDETTNTWEHVEQQTDVLVAEDSRVITLPASAKYARLFLTPLLGTTGATAVNYLHSTGKDEYIATGFTPTSASRADYHFEMDDTAVANFMSPFGSRNANTLQFFAGACSGGNYWFRRYGSQCDDANRGIKWNGEHTFSLNHNSYTLDTVQTTMTRAEFTCACPATIFAVNNNGTPAQFTNMKLFSLALWDDGALVRNYVPCVDTAGVPALYDAVAGTFAYNQGTTPFTVGAPMGTTSEVLIADQTIAVKAIWTGAGDGISASDMANWSCFNSCGNTITGGFTEGVTEIYLAGELALVAPTRIPHKSVAFGPITLTADSDWRGLGTLNLTSRVDVAGHTLTVADVSGSYGEITDGTGWTELDYLDSADGYQNLVTDILPDCTDRIEAEFYFKNFSGNQALWCARGTTATASMTAFMIGAKARFDRNFDTSTFATNNPALKTWTKIVADYKTGEVTINGVFSQQMADGDFTAGSKLCLFASHTGSETNNVANYGHYYIRSFKVYAADGTLKLDFVPRMRNSDSVAGFYDRLTDQFYTSATSTGIRMGKVVSCAATGTLVIDVPENSVTTNDAPSTALEAGVRLNGGLAVRKEGAGTWVQRCCWSCYARGLRIVAGRLELNPSVTSELNRMLGGYGTPIDIEAAGTLDNCAVYDIGGYHGPIRLAGTLTNTGADMRSDWGNYYDLTLTGDAAVDTPSTLGLGSNGFIDLAGHTLSLTVASGKAVYLSSCAQGTTLTNGTVRLVRGGSCTFASPCEMRTVDFEQLGGAITVSAETHVRNYLAAYTDNWNAGTAAFNVYGVFTPQTDYFYGCTLQDGATLDLSSRTTELPATSAFTAGRNEIAYVDGARIIVNLGARTLESGTRIVAWNAKPTATFVWADTNCTVACAAGSDGLYYGANPNSTDVDHATWTGAAGDGDLRNPQNWSCENLAGRVLADRIPEATSAIRLGAGTTFNFTSAQWLPLIDNPSDAENKAETVASYIPAQMAANGTPQFGFMDFAADDYIYLGATSLNQLTNATWLAAHASAKHLRFDGWFKVTDEQAGDWTLRAQADDWVGVWFDGVPVISNAVYNVTATSTCTMTAGWHRFTAVMGDKTGGYGPKLTINGRTTFLGVVANGADEVAFEDGFTFGSGKVFTWQNIDTAGCQLAADCDWCALDLPLDGNTLDLNGHALHVNGLSTTTGTITNSNDSAVGTLRVSTPTFATATKLAANFAGNLHLVKDGAGIFTITGADQTFTAGAEVVAGTLRAGVANAFGATNNVVRVEPDGVIDVNAKTGLENYDLVLAGGSVLSCADGTVSGNGFRSVTLTADSFVTNTYNMVLVGGAAPGTLDLGGHTLTVRIVAGKYLYISQTTMTNGTIVGAYGGHLVFDRAPLDASTVDLDNPGLALGQKVAFPVRNYTSSYTHNYSVSGASLQVKGVFSPLGSHFDSAELQDGATLNLSFTNATWSVTSPITQSGTHTTTFRSGARITVDCTGRELALGDKLVAWTAQPRGVEFRLDAASAAALGSAELTALADGLYVGGGLTWKGGDGDLGDTNKWQTAAGEAPASLDGTRLTVNGTASLTAESKFTLIASTLVVNGTASFTEIGGLCFGGFEVGAAGRVVLDPLVFPIRLLGVPRFQTGARIALASAHAARTKGRFLLMSWDSGVLDPASLTDLFDTTSTAAGASARLTVETVGDGGRLWLDLAPEAAKPRVNVLVLGDGVALGAGTTANFRIPFVEQLEADGDEVVTKGFRTGNGVDTVDAAMPTNWVNHSSDSSMMIASSAKGAGYLEAIENTLDQAGDIDFVVLSVGQNDILLSKCTLDETHDLYTNLVMRILAQKPHAKLLALNWLARDDLPEAAAFNARLADDAAKAVYGAKRLYVADGYSLLPRSQTADWASATLPSRAGNVKLGALLATVARQARAEDPSWQTGAAETVETTTGAEANVPAAERAGFTMARVFDVLAHNGTAIGTSVPYDEEGDGVTEEIGRVAWYIELKRPGRSVRWMWAACDAWGQRNISQVGIPRMVVSQNAVTRLRVKTNMPGLADTADGVYDRGNVEFWASGYGNAAPANADAPGKCWAFDWNDTCGTGSFGSMQLHRSTPNGRNGGETLFAFNAWRLSRNWELGFGNLAYNCLASMDWTFVGERTGGISDALSASSYEIARIEVWTMPLSACADEIASAHWTNGAGDGDAANPLNWDCTNTLGVATANALPDVGTSVTFDGTLGVTLPAGAAYAAITLGDCTLTADLDLRGRGPVSVTGTVDLNGHKLYLDRLVGDGRVTESQVFDLTTTDVTKVSSTTTFFGGVAANLFNNNFARSGTDNNKRVIVTKANLPMTVDYDFGTPTTIDAYRMFFGPIDTGCQTRGPRSWTIEGSNDGATWTVVDSRDIMLWQPSLTYGVIFSLKQPVTYSRYRFQVTDSADVATGYMELVQLEYGRESQFGELHVDVPQGSLMQNSTVTLDGQLKVYKDGAGTLSMPKGGQYFWSLTVNEGTVKGTPCKSTYLFGRAGAPVTIESKGTLDLNGAYEATTYTFNLNGGTLANSSSVANRWQYAGVQNVHLGADSTVSFNGYAFNGWSYASTLFELNGYTLTAKNTGTLCYIDTAVVTEGTLRLEGQWEVYSGKTLDASAARVVVANRLDLNASGTIGEYVHEGTDTFTTYSGVLTVTRRFQPNTDYYRGCTLADGVVIDLTGRTTALNTTSKLQTTGTNVTTKRSVVFTADATYTIDVSGRTLKNGDKLIGWDEGSEPADYDSVSFRLDASTRNQGFRVQKMDDGVYIFRDHTVIFVR